METEVANNAFGLIGKSGTCPANPETIVVRLRPWSSRIDTKWELSQFI